MQGGSMNFIRHNLEIIRRRFINVPEVVAPKTVHSWRHPTGKPNFGDDIFLEIVKKLDPSWLTGKSVGTLYPGGSVLHLLNEGDFGWSIGLNNPKFHFFKKFPKRSHILGVRGPITKAFLEHSLGIKDVEVIGDSALLLPTLFPELCNIKKTVEVGVVRHFNDQASLGSEFYEIDPLRPGLDVVSDILQCDGIISSSLHGIIVAEAYGIPAVWYRPKDLKEPVFKFFDYYLQTNRLPEYYTELSAAKLALNDCKPIMFDVTRLLETFPYKSKVE
jgi:pyruvyltransferase